jgi:hypothetical protein
MVRHLRVFYCSIFVDIYHLVLALNKKSDNFVIISLVILIKADAYSSFFCHSHTPPRLTPPLKVVTIRGNGRKIHCHLDLYPSCYITLIIKTNSHFVRLELQQIILRRWMSNLSLFVLIIYLHEKSSCCLKVTI